MQDFRKLEISNKAIEYCVALYKFSILLPSDEKVAYGIYGRSPVKGH